jgi:hypothetical protein
MYYRPSWPEKNLRLYFQNNPMKKVWRRCSSSKIPVQQAQTLISNTSSAKKKIKEAHEKMFYQNMSWRNTN